MQKDFDVEHDIYRKDAVLEYRNRACASGAGTREFVLVYNGRPFYSVSVMEFLDGKVARETQYFGDPFEPGPSRAQWVERMP